MIGVGYASLKVSQTSLLDLFQEIKSKTDELDGTLIKRHDLHMTLMYDRTNPIPAKNIPYFSKSGEVYKGTVVDSILLGEEGSEHRAVVLLIDSYEIVERHDELRATMKHSFDEFVPHISVIYGATEQDYVILREIISKYIGSSVELYGESFATVKQ